MPSLSEIFGRPRKLPAELRAELEMDAQLLLLEDLRGSVTLRDYRAPRRYSSFSRESTSGAIGIGQTKLIVVSRRNFLIRLPRSPLPDGFEVSVDGDAIRFTYDAAKFRDDTSGTVEVKLKTDQAAYAASLLG